MPSSTVIVDPHEDYCQDSNKRGTGRQDFMLIFLRRILFQNPEASTTVHLCKCPQTLNSISPWPASCPLKSQSYCSLQRSSDLHILMGIISQLLVKIIQLSALAPGFSGTELQSTLQTPRASDADLYGTLQWFPGPQLDSLDLQCKDRSLAFFCI